MSNPAWVSGNSFITGVGTSLSVKNVSGSISAGNLILMVVASFWDQGIPGIPSITDNQHNAYTWLAGKSNLAADGCRIDIFASAPLAAGAAQNGYTATIVAAQSAGTNEIGSSIQEWSGFGLYGATVDVTGSASLGTAAASGTVTLSAGTSVQAVEAVIAGLHFFDNSNPDGIGTPTGTGTWVLDVANLNAAATLAVGYAHQITSATGTAYSATWSGLDTTTSGGGSLIIAALYPAPPPTQGAAMSVAGPGLSPVRLSMFAARPLSAIVFNVTAPLTGQSVVTTSGALAQALAVTAAGRAIVSAAGIAALNLSPPAVGSVLASTPGSLSPSSTVPSLGQGAAFTGGTIAPPGLADVTVTLSGQGGTANAGYATANGDVLVYLAGQSVASSAGLLALSMQPTITSLLAASTAGAFGISVIASLSGQNSTSAIGTVGQGTAIAPTGQILGAALGSLALANVVNLAGQRMTGAQGVFTIAGFGTGTTLDSGIITWDSNIQTWDGGSSASTAATFGQVNPSGPGISPDYTKLFLRQWGDTTSLPSIAAGSISGIPLLSTAGSIFAQINNTLTLGLVGQQLISASSGVTPRIDITAALTGSSMQGVLGQWKFAPTIPIDQEYVASLSPRSFSLKVPEGSAADPLFTAVLSYWDIAFWDIDFWSTDSQGNWSASGNGYTVSVAPRTFTVAGS